jgi:hypothetical protein
MLAHRLRAFALALAAICTAASANPGAAQEPKDPVAVEIEQAIELGVKYLKKEQKPTGFWGEGKGAGPSKGWGVGYTALTGLTLVECGVPISDPGLKRAAAVVRAFVADLDAPYEIALAILFLDRMKEKSDKRIIQFLAARLIAGQAPSGGWGYKVPKYGQPELIQLIAALRKMTPPDEKDDKNPPFDLEKARKAAIAGLPAPMRQLPVLSDPPAKLPADPPAGEKGEKRHDPFDAVTDNSNTHFAMLGVWAARRYDVPVDRTLVLLNRRFRTSQGANGTWGYGFAPAGAPGGGATTCIALLGIAIGHVVDPPAGVKPEADPVILKAFVALTGKVGEPVGSTRNRPTIKEAGGLYYLWTMERIAVLFDLQRLGKKDWYRWGAEILVCNQNGDGSWEQDGGFPGQSPIVNTCLALLFLRRANLTPDLGKQLVVDTSTLTAKVDEKVTPKPEPPPPPKVETPPEIAVAPMPHTPAPKAAPTPVVTPPPPQPQPEAPAAQPKDDSSPWLWVVLGVVLLAAAGGGLFFLIAKRKKAEAAGEGGDDEKPKKKGKKKAKGETAGKPKKKVKAEVEEEE